MRSGGLVGATVGLALSATGCGAKELAPSGSADPSGASDTGTWTIGLPVDDTPSDDPRREPDTGLPPPDSGDPEAAELYLRHGGVAWSELDLFRGHVKLTDGDFTCAELFDAGALLAQGVHTDVDPVHDDLGVPQWEASYRVSDDRPALTNAIVQAAGSGSPVPEDAVLTIHTWTDREVVIEYIGGGLASGPVVVWNCGLRSAWAEP